MRQVAPQELIVSQKVTILEWTSHKDNSWKGEIMEVVNVDLPYVICKFLTGSFKYETESFDSRGVVFGEPSEEYVATMLAGQGNDKANEKIATNGRFLRFW